MSAPLGALTTLLEQTAALHNHLCPRQVLGVRMGMQATALFDLALPQTDKRLYAFVETDGCFADGISVATGCWLGRRTLRLMDYGKTAVTLVDSDTGKSVRLWPHPDARQAAHTYVPQAKSHWHTMLAAYQIMPVEQLLRWSSVELNFSMQEVISRAGIRVTCELCGEDIINEREVKQDGHILCQACGGHPYYRHADCTADYE